MIRLAISVEGATEREFINTLLHPHLLDRGVVATPIVVTTRRVLCGPNCKGGAINIDRVKAEITPLLYSFDYVTTLYDFYGFRGKKPNETVEQLLSRMASIVGNPESFLPYLQLHEFEALLFSGPEVTAEYLQCPQAERDVRMVVEQCGGAEAVNDDPAMAPSKRFDRIFKECGEHYDKSFHGPLMALDIGLNTMRGACPRFDHWVGSLEGMGT